MAKEAVYMPKLGMTMTQGLITEWFVGVGDTVAKGDELLTIETEKVESTIDAENGGVLVEIISAEDCEVDVGAIIGYIETDGS